MVAELLSSIAEGTFDCKASRRRSIASSTFIMLGCTPACLLALESLLLLLALMEMKDAVLSSPSRNKISSSG